MKPNAWSYINPVDWKARDQAPNRDFFELVKRMIRIRRSYPEIFEYFPARVKDSNICKVETDQKGRLQAYARYRNGQAVLIVPNDGKTAEKFRISIPRRAAGITSSSVTVLDLLNERRLFSGKPATFEAEIPAGMLGVYLVEPAK